MRGNGLHLGARAPSDAPGPDPERGTPSVVPLFLREGIGHGGATLRAEIARLAALLRADYAAARVQAAAEAGVACRDLDKAVAAERARRRAEAGQEGRCGPEPGPGEVRWPPGTTLGEDGLYAGAGGDGPPLWLAARFDVLGHTRDGVGRNWGLLLRWRDRDGHPNTWAMPMRLLMAAPGALEAELVDRGLSVSASPAARLRLRQALAEVRVGTRARLAYRAGWQEGAAGAAFLLPDGTVLGETAETVLLHNPPDDADRLCAAAGTLAGWRDGVAALAVGNPLAAFCTAAAFVGPLLMPFGQAGGGFHLFGGSKRGKTLGAQLGLSAWGLPYKGAALRDWNGTANAFEAAAEESGDMLLVLDELHQADPAEVARIAYMLADGAGKGRLRRDASAARRRTWRAFVLSTGEHDLAIAVARAGQRLAAGADVRLPSVPVEDAAEAWPNLHGRADQQALWTELHRAMRSQHGEAARAFVGQLAAALATDPAGVREAARAVRDRFAAALPACADPQVHEVAKRFALVAAAGELARVWGVLPWPEGEAERAGFAMLAAWLARRAGGAGSTETAAHLERVRLFLVQHGSSRFTTLVQEHGTGAWVEASPDRPVANRAGWRKRREEGGRDEYLIAPEAWRAEVCAPACLDPTATAQTLANAGLLRRGEQRRLQAEERVPGLARAARVYAISAAILEAPPEA